MTFNKLTSVELGIITETYLLNKSQEADRILSDRFDVSERSIRNWARKLGLTGDVANVEVISPEKVKVEPHHHAKILVFDLETSPLQAYVWGLWQQNIGHNLGMLQSDWFLLTWSAKWLFEEKILSDRLTGKEALEENDARIVGSLWRLIDEADIIIAHNAVKFDVKKMNTRFLMHGLPSPSPYRIIDTLQAAKKRLSVSSNKLDYLGEFLGVGRKLETDGFMLWKESVEGNHEALKKMEEYNIRDITLLEDVYLKLRPYIQPHPNLGLFIETDVEACPTCGSEDLEYTGTYTTNSNVYEAVRCNGCGSVGRSRKSKLRAGDKENLLLPTAR